MKCFKALPLLALAMGVAAGQAPSVTTVFNAASNEAAGLPNSGIAQGAIFVVQGSNMGPTTLSFATTPFQGTNLDGTEVSVQVGSVITYALMYYTSAGQLAALLPSNTPLGTGALIVAYEGSTSASFSITVVANNAGVFTVSEDGQGLAIATYPDYSLVSAVPGTGSLADTCTAAGQACPDTYAGAAHPGDLITLWATGLGPVSGGDSASSLGQTVNIPLTLWIGGVSVAVSYQGRSGCCIGEDQIQFTVPSNVPTGCAVPVIIQIGTLVSNSSMLPIASSGRSCTPSSPAITPAVVQALTTATGPIIFSNIQLERVLNTVNSGGVFYEDYGTASFGQATVSYLNQASQYTVISSLDTQPLGTCFSFPFGSIANPTDADGNPLLLTPIAEADPGTLTITGPNGELPLADHGGTPNQYSGVFSALGTYFSGGAYTLAASGGTGGNIIGPFKVNFNLVGPAPTWQGTDQNRLLSAGVSRANGFTINWTSGSANWNVLISGFSNTDITGDTGAAFSCLVPSTLNTFTVPPSITLGLPSGIFAEIDFKPVLPEQSFTANGLNVGLLNFDYLTTLFPPIN